MGELYDDNDDIYHDIYRTFRYPFATFNTTIYNGSMTTRLAAYRAVYFESILTVTPFPVTLETVKIRYVFDESSMTFQDLKDKTFGGILSNVDCLLDDKISGELCYVLRFRMLES